MKQVLFLCTGNYYRSRYAELLFNALAPAAGLPGWQAESRGLDVSAGSGNVGPMSYFVIARLGRQGIEAPAEPRPPLQAAGEDLAAADLVIALKEAEHRPMIDARFERWAHRVEYWQVHDIDLASPPVALALIEEQVDALLRRLAAG